VRRIRALAPGASGSQRTHRWRETDSNHRSPRDGDCRCRALRIDRLRGIAAAERAPFQRALLPKGCPSRAVTGRRAEFETRDGATGRHKRVVAR
jgi:hypothetical protein